MRYKILSQWARLRRLNQFTRKRRGLLLLLVCTLLISACGSGGSEDKIPAPIPPLQVSTGLDQRVNEQTSISISGAAVGGEGSLSYAWQADPRILITHDDKTRADAVLLAPSLTQQEVFTISLTVSDARGVSAVDTFILTVDPVNLPPIANIQVNRIDNYALNIFPVGAEVILDASESVDEDAPAGLNPIASYQWQQLAGTSILQGLDLQSSTLRFTTRISNQQETIKIQLSVVDQEGAVSQTEVDLILLGQSGTIPELVVAPTSAIFSGETALLSATASSQAPDAAPFTYRWRVLNDDLSNLTIEAPMQAQTRVQLAEQNIAKEYRVEVQVSDSFGNQISKQSILYTDSSPSQRINDTGVNHYSNNQGLSDTGTAEFSGQDADHGRDAEAMNGDLSKVGRGELGFDFTKLNTNGDPVDAPSLSWSCVRDNVTGLVWEVKRDDIESLHYFDQRFSWYQEENNGNYPGELNMQSSSCTLDTQTCNTQAFLQAVNEAGLCGFYDWRIPTHSELQSLLHYGKTQAPLADTAYFPLWGSGSDGQLWYWTNQSSADGVSEDSARNAWAIDLVNGVDNFMDKGRVNYVRLVRAGRGGL